MFFKVSKKVSSYHLINNPRKLSWVANELLNSKEFSFDIETNHPTIKINNKPPNFVEYISCFSFALCINKL